MPLIDLITYKLLYRDFKYGNFLLIELSQLKSTLTCAARLLLPETEAFLSLRRRIVEATGCKTASPGFSVI